VREIEVDAGALIIEQPVGVRELDRPHRRGHAHVALVGVGGEVVDRRESAP